MSPLFPPVFFWTVGIASAMALAKLVRREYLRVNEELERSRSTSFAGSKDQGEQRPTLRRDPRTGIYHP